MRINFFLLVIIVGVQQVFAAFAAFQQVFAAVTTEEFCKQKQIDKETLTTGARIWHGLCGYK